MSAQFPTPIEALKRLVTGLFPAMKFTPLLAEAWLAKFSWANDSGLHDAIRRARASDLTARELSPDRVSEELRQAGFVPPSPPKREIVKTETRVIVDVISHLSKWSHLAAKELVEAYQAGREGDGQREMREANVLIWHAYWLDFDAITRNIDARHRRLPEMVADQLRGLWAGLGTLEIVGNQTMQQRQRFELELAQIAMRLNVPLGDEPAASVVDVQDASPF